MVVLKVSTSGSLQRLCLVILLVKSISINYGEYVQAETSEEGKSCLPYFLDLA